LFFLQRGQHDLIASTRRLMTMSGGANVGFSLYSIVRL